MSVSVCLPLGLTAGLTDNLKDKHAIDPSNKQSLYLKQCSVNYGKAVNYGGAMVLLICRELFLQLCSIAVSHRDEQFLQQEK